MATDVAVDIDAVVLLTVAPVVRCIITKLFYRRLAGRDSGNIDRDIASPYGGGSSSWRGVCVMYSIT